MSLTTTSSTALPADGALTKPDWWFAIRRSSARFWREFLFWWAEHCPRLVLWTRPFFLWFAWRFSRTLRNGTLTNARRLLGPNVSHGERVAFGRRVVENFYLSVYEIGASCRLTKEQLRTRIEGIEGSERYLAARSRRKGAVLVTAHLGSFELGVAALLDRERRLHVVFRRDEFPRFERLRSRLHSRLGVIEAPIEAGWSIWARLRNALLADEVVLIQGDRVMPGQRGIEVPFFSGHIQMPLGPIKLAYAAGSPIIPVFSIRTAVHRARVMIGKPIWICAPPSEVRAEAGGRAMDSEPGLLRPAILELAKAMERQVAVHPDQWLMVEPVWCEDAQFSYGQQPG